MSEAKRYYWLKLKAGFFDEKTTKYLRALPDGDKLVIVYLQMQLKSLTTNGLLKYDKLFPVVEEELALLLGEDVNIVKFTVQALIKANAASILDDGSIVLLAMKDLIGSETASTQRSRECRARKVGQKALHCNKNATPAQQDATILQRRDRERVRQREELDKELEQEKYSPAEPDNTHTRAHAREENLPKPTNTKFKEQSEDIINYLNAKLNTKYKANNKKTLELIKARISEGFTVEDFKTVIDKKAFEWAGDANMCQYLRPVTLFSTKFESYLNQPQTRQMSETDQSIMKFLNSGNEGVWF